MGVLQILGVHYGSKIGGLSQSGDDQPNKKFKLFLWVFLAILETRRKVKIDSSQTGLH